MYGLVFSLFFAFVVPADLLARRMVAEYTGTIRDCGHYL
jgi:hypothetical protein